MRENHWVSSLWEDIGKRVEIKVVLEKLIEEIFFCNHFVSLCKEFVNSK